jgi:hypothetical protein
MFIRSRNAFCFLLVGSVMKIALLAEKTSEFPPVKKTESGLYQFGGILIDKEKKSFSFPAVCNQTSGLVEYALVHQNGKTHESLMRTEISPRMIHACLLLLKEKPEYQFFAYLEKNSTKISQARGIDIVVEWEQNGTLESALIHTMVTNQNDNQELNKHAFVFTGSKVIEGTYLAQMDGSIVAIYHDSRATLNSRDLQSHSDDVWIANEQRMPPVDFPVTIRFQLQN